VLLDEPARPPGHAGALDLHADDDGYITYLGRSDDVFKASDHRISPFEPESVLIEHPAVAEAAVVPAPDPVRLAVPQGGRRPGCRPRRRRFLEDFPDVEG